MSKVIEFPLRGTKISQWVRIAKYTKTKRNLRVASLWVQRNVPKQFVPFVQEAALR